MFKPTSLAMVRPELLGLTKLESKENAITYGEAILEFKALNLLKIPL